ncbi:MAG: HD domain-containing protein [Chloroflexi bacterium]|nr:HD domain-containing protein [Chloroflexota bacterium]
MSAILHRLAQGFRALLAFAASPDLGMAQRYLTQREYAAFKRMSRAEQLHSLNVLRSVLQAEPNAPAALAAAALLHDVGKSRYHLAVWQKTLAVLLLQLAPRLSHRLSQSESLNRWRAPFAVQRNHPKWSAEILDDCGSDAGLIWLAENHHEDAKLYLDHDHYALLIALQAADSSC